MHRLHEDQRDGQGLFQQGQTSIIPKRDNPRWRIYYNLFPSGMTYVNQMVFVPLTRDSYFCIVGIDGNVMHREFPGGSYRPGWPHLTLERG